MPRTRTGLLVTAMAIVMSGCESPGEDASGPRLELGFEVIENKWESARGDMFAADLTLTNTGAAPLDSAWTLYFNFQRDVVPVSLPPEVVVTRIAGDFQSLAPTASWTPLAPGETRRITFDGLWPLTKITDAPMGAYLVIGDGADAQAPIPVRVIVGALAPPGGGHPAGRPEDQPLIPTAASRYRENEKVSALAAEEIIPIVPTPVRFERGTGTVTLDGSWRVVHAAGLEYEAALLADALGQAMGARPRVEAGTEPGAGTVSLSLGAPMVGGSARATGSEAYTLTASSDGGVRIVGSDPAGVLYGAQSLRALLPIEAHRTAAPSLAIPAVTIEDAPRFAYRGLHLDVARNFHSRATVEKLLRLMAFYKLNRFHFHLTDDEGWRLEIAQLPELTAVGGRRGHTLDESDRLVPSFGSGPDPDPRVSPGSGFYTKQDFIEILRLATALHIQVIPEIDGPGHARAAVKSMEARYQRLARDGREEDARAFLLTDPDDRSQHRSVQGWSDNIINPCLESTYRFMDTVVGEIQGMYREAGAELTAIHIGGDEVPRGVWEASPACEAFLREHADIGGVPGLFNHFVERVNALIQPRGVKTAGWEEIALAELEGGGKGPNPGMLDRGLQPYIWNSLWRGGAEELAYRLANAGYPVVLANATNLYFDLAYDRDPLEPGFTWAGLTDARTAYEFVPFDVYRSAREDLAGRPIDPDTEYAGRLRPTEQGRRNILGIQGQIWSENANSIEMMEFLAFPKLLGLAERAWAAESEWERIPARAARDRALDISWNEFASRVGTRELPRLDHLEGGVAYRLPPPGAVIESGTLRANLPYPGLQIRYTTDGSEPTRASPLYQGPVAVQGEVRLRAFDTRGRGGREVWVGGQPG